MRRTKTEAEITRQNLLDAALNVFSRKGYAATRLEDIAAEANVTRGAIYHHFGGKPELYETLVGESAMEVVPLMEEAVRDGQDTIDSLHRVFTLPLIYATTNPRYRAVSELMMFKTEATEELSDGWNEKIRLNIQWVQTVSVLVEKGQAIGEIRADLEPRDVVVGLLSLQGGLLAMWMMNPGLIDLEARADHIADIYLRGISAK